MAVTDLPESRGRGVTGVVGGRGDGIRGALNRCVVVRATGAEYVRLSLPASVTRGAS